MIINHPLLGPRDAAEFVCLGDASLIDRPDPAAEDAAELDRIRALARRLHERWKEVQPERADSMSSADLEALKALGYAEDG